MRTLHTLLVSALWWALRKLDSSAGDLCLAPRTCSLCHRSGRGSHKGLPCTLALDCIRFPGARDPGATDLWQPRHAGGVRL